MKREGRSVAALCGTGTVTNIHGQIRQVHASVVRAVSRRTCARLCYLAGGELEQIQFLPGHVSVETTERYLGCKQKLKEAANDRIGLEPTAD